MGAAVAIIVRKQRDIVEVFEGARATSPETARVPDELGVDQSVVFRGLIRRAVLRDAGDGRYYVDLPTWRATSNRRLRVALIAVALVLLAGIVVAMSAGHRN